MLSDLEIVTIVQLIIFIPILFLSVVIALRHGFSRDGGWLFLILLSLTRVVGCSLQLAAIHQNNEQCQIGAVVCSGIGTSYLVLVLMGLTKRTVYTSRLGSANWIQRPLNLAGLALLVALIVNIVAGTKIYSSNPSTAAEGQKESKAAIILYLLAFIVIAGFAIYRRSLGQYGGPGNDITLQNICIAVIPFILVRIIWGMLEAFGRRAKYAYATDYWIGMAVAMEFVAAILYVIAGFTASKLAKEDRKLGPKKTRPGPF